jgi:hypothetical protein
MMSSVWLFALAARVTETAGAHAVLDIENQVFTRTLGDSHGDRIELERTKCFPRNHVIGTGGTAAYPTPPVSPLESTVAVRL